MSNRIVAIDGPSASGKSTVARKVAFKLGYLYVDSGAVYRAVTWMALQKGNAADVPACKTLVERLKFECFVKDGAVKFKINGLELISELRTDAVNENVSAVSAIPEVRAKVVSWLRNMLGFGRLVMEGRDIGTAVFPNADFKFYLDADPDERARRRSAEIAGSGGKAEIPTVRDSLKRRDTIDSSRKKDPLKIAPEAVVVDTTAMTIEDVTDLIIEHIKKHKKSKE